MNKRISNRTNMITKRNRLTEGKDIALEWRKMPMSGKPMCGYHDDEILIIAVIDNYIHGGYEGVIEIIDGDEYVSNPFDTIDGAKLWVEDLMATIINGNKILYSKNKSLRNPHRKNHMNESEDGRKLFTEYNVYVDDRLYETSHTKERCDEIVSILTDMYPDSEVKAEPYKHYVSGYERKKLEKAIEKQKAEYSKNESLNKKYRRRINEKLSLTDDEDVIAEANEIIDNFNPVAVEHEADYAGQISVKVRDKASGLAFWVDVWTSYGDLNHDWNQYIFFNDRKDAIKELVQEDSGVFELAIDAVDDYLYANHLIYDCDDEICMMNESYKPKKAIKRRRK